MDSRTGVNFKDAGAGAMVGSSIIESGATVGSTIIGSGAKVGSIVKGVGAKVVSTDIGAGATSETGRLPENGYKPNF